MNPSPFRFLLPRMFAAMFCAVIAPQLTAAVDTAMPLPPTISSDAKVENLATLPTESYTVSGRPFTEGTTTAPNGDVFFVEQNSNKIMRWSVADKKLSVFMHPAGYSNGMS